MLIKAPTFEEVSEHVLELLDQSVVVCHNARFDVGFLEMELGRARMKLPKIKGVCTLGLSRIVVPDIPSRKLEVLCNYFDIDLFHAHSAYHDCMATKELFLRLFELYADKFGVDDFFQKFYSQNVIALESAPGKRGRIEHKRFHARDAINKEGNRLKDMLLRLPENTSEKEVPLQEYLNILDDILADRIITEEETDQILLLAATYSISRQEALKIHEEYLRRLVRAYLLDGVVSEAESEDLTKVSKLLGIEGKLIPIIELEQSKISSLTEPAPRGFDYAGKSVCFTGELISKIEGKPIDRQFAHEIALEKGLIVKSGISKKLDMLVVANPHTQSGKAKKARELNIPIIAEAVFWRMIGVQVE
jgi:DNA polymerase III subunit epsilon